MEEVSEEDSGSCTEEKKSIRRECGMDGECDDEECEDTRECLWNGFCEEDDDNAAREREEEYDCFLEWVAEVTRYECGRKNKES